MADDSLLFTGKSNQLLWFVSPSEAQNWLAKNSSTNDNRFLYDANEDNVKMPFTPVSYPLTYDIIRQRSDYVWQGNKLRSNSSVWKTDDNREKTNFNESKLTNLEEGMKEFGNDYVNSTNDEIEHCKLFTNMTIGDRNVKNSDNTKNSSIIDYTITTVKSDKKGTNICKSETAESRNKTGNILGENETIGDRNVRKSKNSDSFNSKANTVSNSETNSNICKSELSQSKNETWNIKCEDNKCLLRRTDDIAIKENKQQSSSPRLKLSWVVPTKNIFTATVEVSLLTF